MLERNAWIFRASLFGETKFPTLLGLKTNGVQQGAAVNAPPALFFKGAARCGSTDVVQNKALSANPLLSNALNLHSQKCQYPQACALSARGARRSAQACVHTHFW
jgi:hypothetical protein